MKNEDLAKELELLRIRELANIDQSDAAVLNKIHEDMLHHLLTQQVIIGLTGMITKTEGHEKKRATQRLRDFYMNAPEPLWMAILTCYINMVTRASECVPEEIAARLIKEHPNEALELMSLAEANKQFLPPAEQVNYEKIKDLCQRKAEETRRNEQDGGEVSGGSDSASGG